MNYIPADKLIAQIKELRSESCISEADDYYEYAKSEILDIITSLQQEQPEVDIDREIEEYLDDFIKTPTRDYFRNAIMHFYTLGRNARKED